MFSKYLSAFASLQTLTLQLLFHSEGPARDYGIHLAVEPKCGNLSSGIPANTNFGVYPLGDYNTIISFGDSFTSTGTPNGGTPSPPIVRLPSLLAGGRVSDGYMWVEYLKQDYHIPSLRDYAIGGAVTSSPLWPKYSLPSTDFVHQVATFRNQHLTPDPNTTLYTIFFGINDNYAAITYGPASNMLQAAQVILNQIALLMMPPINARSFLVLDIYGRGTPSEMGEQFKQKVFEGLYRLSQNNGDLRVGYVDFRTLWTGVLNNPGLEAFGFRALGPCWINPQNICRDRAHTFYWSLLHPGTQGHRLMADYVTQVVDKCQEYF
ncbi:carbohydrate esterase family 16 protein [Sphaerobolus stellatus SS14]|uniref:Carbohydrate esterase family 16 protein n=1 Tax=Sphaerobolus stellatus (strain SS14) TaxID=990650 RepID=A0A0C9U919_SPHS4|nr:carbohydrate esterase family 16 protein [Sphaerobolus stellatus SS14]